MSRSYIAVCLLIVVATLSSNFQSTFAEDGANVSLLITALHPTAISGCPVIIELAYRNEGKDSATIYSPFDYFLAYSKVRWVSGVETYQFQLRDLHYGAIPESGPTPRFQLAPGQIRSWIVSYRLH